jgi:hypothetical protein
MSTADRIRKMLHLPNAVIAQRLGCSPAYFAQPIALE